jgi:hypothetical protein
MTKKVSIKKEKKIEVEEEDVLTPAELVEETPALNPEIAELENLLNEMDRLGVNRKSEVEARLAQLRLQ